MKRRPLLPTLLALCLGAACGSTAGGGGYYPVVSDISSNFGIGGDGAGATSDSAGTQGDGSAANGDAAADGAGGGGGGSDAANSDDVASDVAAQDATPNDATGSDTSTPDTTTQDTGTPDTATADTGTPDTGTPDTGTPDTGTPDTATPDTGAPDAGSPDTGSPDTTKPDTVASAPPPAVGELIITEFMANPAIASDNDGEWFEVCNVGNAARSFADCHIADEKDSHAIQDGGSLVVAPGACVVFGKTKDQQVNAMVPVDYAYGSAIPLNNTGTESITLSCGGPAKGGVPEAGATVIDTVKWGQSGDSFPSISAGASNRLHKDFHTSSANDLGANWCTPLLPKFGAGELGTPGQFNTTDCKN